MELFLFSDLLSLNLSNFAYLWFILVANY